MKKIYIVELPKGTKVEVMKGIQRMLEKKFPERGWLVMTEAVKVYELGLG